MAKEFEVEFSWTILWCVIAGNTAYMAAMFVVQQLDESLPPRHSLIKGTNRRFLHMQDWWTGWWGDWLAVPLIINAFVHVAINNMATNLLAVAMLGTALAGGFLWMCLGENHEVDQGFPEPGKISVNGILHLPYFGLGWASGLICLWSIFMGELSGPVLWLGLVGGAFYLLCAIADLIAGHFDPRR